MISGLSVLGARGFGRKILTSSTGGDVIVDAVQMEKWLPRAHFLAWFTILYNLLEGVVSIGFGISDDAVALAGFGGDSFIEVGSATLVLWRFRVVEVSGRVMNLKRERSATFGIGILFLLLALVVGTGAVLQLRSGAHPETTVPGIVISSLSLSFMFWLWRSKLRVARALDSMTVAKDAACSLACIKLSIILFAGSIIYFLWPSLWWVDGAASLGLAYFIFREGLETVEAARKPHFQGGCGCH